jgi:hypothetical protein
VANKINNLPRVAFSGMDFDNIITDIKDFIKNNPSYNINWEDFTEANAGRMLIELFASIADQMAIRMDWLVNETFLTTATQDKSIFNLLKLIGYRPALAYTAAVNVNSIITNGFSNNFQFEKFYSLDGILSLNGTPTTFELFRLSDDGSYDYVNQYTWDMAKGTTQSLTFYAGKTIDETFTLSGSDDEVIALASKNIIEGSIKAYYIPASGALLVDNELQGVDSFISQEAQAKDALIPFVVETNEFGDIFLRFASARIMNNENDYGTEDDYLVFKKKIATAGDTVRIYYRIGGGDSSNIVNNSINLTKTLNYNGSDVVIAFNNIEGGAGGVNAETLQEAKVNGPLEISTGKRTVTNDDYEIIIGKNNNTLKSKSFSPSNPPPSNELYSRYGLLVNPTTVWHAILKDKADFRDKTVEDYKNNYFEFTTAIQHKLNFEAQFETGTMNLKLNLDAEQNKYLIPAEITEALKVDGEINVDRITAVLTDEYIDNGEFPRINDIINSGYGANGVFGGVKTAAEIDDYINYPPGADKFYYFYIVVDDNYKIQIANNKKFWLFQNGETGGYYEVGVFNIDEEFTGGYFHMSLYNEDTLENDLYYNYPVNCVNEIYKVGEISAVNLGAGDNFEQTIIDYLALTGQDSIETLLANGSMKLSFTDEMLPIDDDGATFAETNPDWEFDGYYAEPQETGSGIVQIPLHENTNKKVRVAFIANYNIPRYLHMQIGQYDEIPETETYNFFIDGVDESMTGKHVVDFPESWQTSILNSLLYQTRLISFGQAFSTIIFVATFDERFDADMFNTNPGEWINQSVVQPESSIPEVASMPEITELDEYQSSTGTEFDWWIITQGSDLYIVLKDFVTGTKYAHIKADQNILIEDSPLILNKETLIPYIKSTDLKETIKRTVYAIDNKYIFDINSSAGYEKNKKYDIKITTASGDFSFYVQSPSEGDFTIQNIADQLNTQTDTGADFVFSVITGNYLEITSNVGNILTITYVSNESTTSGYQKFHYFEKIQYNETQQDYIPLARYFFDLIVDEDPAPNVVYITMPSSGDISPATLVSMINEGILKAEQIYGREIGAYATFGTNDSKIRIYSKAIGSSSKIRVQVSSNSGVNQLLDLLALIDNDTGSIAVEDPIDGSNEALTNLLGGFDILGNTATSISSVATFIDADIIITEEDTSGTGTGTGAGTGTGDNIRYRLAKTENSNVPDFEKVFVHYIWDRSGYIEALDETYYNRFLNNYRLGGVNNFYIQPIINSFDLKVRITYDPTFNPDTIKEQVKTAVRNNYSLLNQDFGEVVRKSDIYKIITAVPGVKFLEVKYFGRDYANLYRDDGRQGTSDESISVYFDEILLPSDDKYSGILKIEEEQTAGLIIEMTK